MTPLESSEVTLQVVASPTLVFLAIPEVSFMLLENIDSTVANIIKLFWNNLRN